MQIQYFKIIIKFGKQWDRERERGERERFMAKKKKSNKE